MTSKAVANLVTRFAVVGVLERYSLFIDLVSKRRKELTYVREYVLSEVLSVRFITTICAFSRTHSHLLSLVIISHLISFHPVLRTAGKPTGPQGTSHARRLLGGPKEGSLLEPVATCWIPLPRPSNLQNRIIRSGKIGHTRVPRMYWPS